MANKGRLGMKASRPRILRARDPLSYLTTQMAQREVGTGTFAKAIEKSKNVFYQGGRPRITSRTRVRRLFVRDPYNVLTGDTTFGSGRTVATFAPEMDQFTNNPNKQFDPSKGSSNPQEVSVLSTRTSANAPGKAGRGHGKVIRRTLFNQNTGKRLKRR